MNDNVDNRLLDRTVYSKAKELYDRGFEKAPEFLRQEGCGPLDLLKALTVTRPGGAKPSEVILDAGAIAWCLKQLEGEYNEQ